MPFEPSYYVPAERRTYTLIPPAVAEPGPGKSPGSVGCLILHGYLGSPASSRPMAGFLAARGMVVHCPLLPGHGEYPNKLYGVSRELWLEEAEEGLRILRNLCEEIVLIGHSMGNVLCAHLVADNSDIRGHAMVAPAFTVPSRAIHTMRILRYIMPWFYPHRFQRFHGLVRDRMLEYDASLNYDDPEVQARLPEMSRVPTASIDEMRKTLDYGRKLWPNHNIPVIILQGTDDIAVDPANTQKLFNQLPNPARRLVLLGDSGHECMRPADPAHGRVWQEVYDFFCQVTSLIKNQVPE